MLKHVLLGGFQCQELAWSSCILDGRSGRCLGSQVLPPAPAPPHPSWMGLRGRAPRWTHRRRRSATGQRWTREGVEGAGGEGGECQQARRGVVAEAWLLSPSSQLQPDASATKNLQSYNAKMQRFRLDDLLPQTHL